MQPVRKSALGGCLFVALEQPEYLFAFQNLSLELTPQRDADIFCRLKSTSFTATLFYAL
jgi:hypothetical protein